MSSASEAKHTLDWLKWLVVVALVAAGIYLNMEYALTSLLVRALAGVACGCLCRIALQTAAGRSVWELAKEARIEIRRWFGQLAGKPRQRLSSHWLFSTLDFRMIDEGLSHRRNDRVDR